MGWKMMMLLLLLIFPLLTTCYGYKLNNNPKSTFIQYLTPKTADISLPIDSSSPHLRTRRKIPTCNGPLACYCYSRATQRHFCCKCIDDTCFPEDATVQLEDGRHLQMKDLRLGHRILASDETGQLVYSPVIAFLDRRPKKYGTYLGITTENGKEIYLSGNHLIFTVNTRASNTSAQSTFADKIITRDLVLVTNNSGLITPAVVTNITREIKRGAFVPLTESGTLVVGGVLASCYASVSSHRLAHVVLTPVRLWPHLFETEHSQLIDGVRGYVRVLKTMTRWLLPTNSMSNSIFNRENFFESFTRFQFIFTTV